MKEYFKLLRKYKYEGDYLNNFKELIEILKLCKKSLIESFELEKEVFAKHLILEARNHLLGMSYSKSYEFASETRENIERNAYELINVFKTEKTAFKVLIEKLIIDDEYLKENSNQKVISVFIPWLYYLEQSETSYNLFYLPETLNLKELTYELTIFEKYRIGKKENIYEILDSIFNIKRLEYLIKNAE
tara:strand:- start:4468 stop:5034 length:567 start_codon:yes stop_codon:yes gene_type:complete